MKGKEESEKVGLILNFQKTNIMATDPITPWQKDGETMETVTKFTLLGSKVTAGGDWNHDIKRCLLIGRKAMTELNSILQSRDITLPTKVHLLKAMVFPVVVYGCESWTIKKAEYKKKLMLLKCGVGEDSWESLGLQGDPTSQSQRKSILNIHWKDWSSSWNSSTLATWCKELTHVKRPWSWERLKQKKGMTVDEMVGWHHRLNEFEQALRVGNGQGTLPYSSPCGRKESDTTEQLNWTEDKYSYNE